MTDQPCSDLHCECCHPEEQHSCPGPYEDSTGAWTCPECGVTWTERHGRPPHWPDDVDHPGRYWQADRPVPLVSELARREREAS